VYPVDFIALFREEGVLGDGEPHQRSSPGNLECDDSIRSNL